MPNELNEGFYKFADAMADKFLKGRDKHGTAIVVDPFEEAKKECIDLANYAKIGYDKVTRLQEMVSKLPTSSDPDQPQWQVRSATIDDLTRIDEMAHQYADKVNPYVLNPNMVKVYRDEWLVAVDSSGKIGGAMRYVSQDKEKEDRNRAYLHYVKQIPSLLVNEFYQSPESTFLSQPACPGKGSLRAIVNYLKSRSPHLWLWISVNSSLYSFFSKQLEFHYRSGDYSIMNVNKGDWSTFRIGRWSR